LYVLILFIFFVSGSKTEMEVREEINWIKKSLPAILETGKLDHNPIIVMIGLPDMANIMAAPETTKGPPILWVPSGKNSNTFAVTLNLLAEATQGEMTLLIEMSGNPFTAKKLNHPGITERILALQNRWNNMRIATTSLAINMKLGHQCAPNTTRARYKKKDIPLLLRKFLQHWLGLNPNTKIERTEYIMMKKVIRHLEKTQTSTTEQHENQISGQNL